MAGLADAVPSSATIRAYRPDDEPGLLRTWNAALTADPISSILIRKHRPDVLITHWRGSFHRDHRATYTNVMESLFLAGLPAFRREHPAHSGFRLYFAENWEDWDDFRPDIYLDVADVWDRYLAAIRAYSLFRGEVSTFPYEQWYTGASLLRGAMAGCGRAVGLMRPERQGHYTVADLSESVLN